MSNAAETGRSHARRATVALLGTALLLLGGGVLAARTVDLGRVLDAVRTADPGLLAVAVAGYLLSWPLRGQRYSDVLAAMGHRCGTAFLTAAVFVSQATNLVVPARAGDGVRAYLLSTRREVSYPTGAASLAVERLFDLLALAGVGVVALVCVLPGNRGAALTESRWVLLGAGAVGLTGVFGAAVTLALARSNRRPGPWLQARTDRPRVRVVVDAAVRFGADVRVVATDAGALARVGLGSLAIWVIDAFTAVLVLAALDDTLATPGLVAVGALAVAVGNLAKVLPLSQGGVGLYEAAFTALVVAVSPVAGATALAAAVLDHALKNLVTLAGGAVAALVLNVSPATVREGGQAKAET